MGKSMNKSGKPRNSLVFFLFLLPSVFAFFMIIVIPFLMGIYYSLTDWTAITGAGVEWVGLKNFMAIGSDVTFLNSFLITMVYSIVSIIVLNVVAFFLALLVTSNISHTGVYRAGFFLPNLIGGLILGYIWQFIFNSAIPAFGSMIGFTWLHENIFLADRALAVLAIVIVGTWQYAGYIMMIYVAALQAIPVSLLEAAEIDGANSWHRLKSITFPLVAPAFTVSMFLTLVNSFKQFDVNFALTAGGPAGMFMGKPVMTNQFLALNIYQTAFSYQRLAEAQAKAVVFFIVITVFSLIQVRHNKRREIEM
jgi:raffinose/stachyose/melibiose transport system permease protein